MNRRFCDPIWICNWWTIASVCGQRLTVNEWETQFIHFGQSYGKQTKSMLCSFSYSAHAKTGKCWPVTLPYEHNVCTQSHLFVEKYVLVYVYGWDEWRIYSLITWSRACDMRLYVYLSPNVGWLILVAISVAEEELALVNCMRHGRTPNRKANMAGRCRQTDRHQRISYRCLLILNRYDISTKIGPLTILFLIAFSCYKGWITNCFLFTIHMDYTYCNSKWSQTNNARFIAI